MNGRAHTRMEDPPAPPPQAPREEHAPAKGAVAERPAPTPSRPTPRKLPPYRVILHNDDHNSHLFVVETLVELTPLNKVRAVEVMLEAEESGAALVLVTHRERAELYQEQLASRGLTATVEPAE